MPSKKNQLQKRGFLSDTIYSDFESLTFNEKIALLESNIAAERTLGARLLKEHKTKKTVLKLISALKTEKQLYAKIEICYSLAELNEIAIQPLIQCLGEIGNNQHKKLTKKTFSKDSYPLPRDIASRVLIRIGEGAIPQLLEELKITSRISLIELIDTIGHINYYSNGLPIYEALLNCYHLNKSDDLIRWKIFRAYSGVAESENFLKEQHEIIGNKRLKLEIERSLRLINKRNC